MGDRMTDAERAVVKAVRAHGFSTLRVLRENEAVIEIGPQNLPVPIHSIRKSILSSLFGPLIGRGAVQLSTTLAELGLDDSPCLTEHERAVTLRHLLTSSSGVYLPLQNDASSYDIFRNVPAEWPMRGSAAPGARFHYSNWDFNILGEIYQRVCGLPIFIALDGILAQPMGFRDWCPFEHSRLHYFHDRLGATMRYPNYAIQLSARDLASFGQLYLNGGMWNGSQILPPEWVRESTRSHIRTGLQRPFDSYGYLWWTTDGDDPAGLPAGGFSAIGLGGQIVSVIPSHQMVIVAQRQQLDSRALQMALPTDLVKAVIQQ